MVAVGTHPGDASITKGFRNYGIETAAYIDGLDLTPSTENNTLYYVTVKVENNANSISEEMSSNPIHVYQENKPGQVFDGRDIFTDQDFSRDIFTTGMSFQGFESAACGIISYDWAIGTQPGYSDVLPFTKYGIVMKNETHGFAEISLSLNNKAVLFTTVRAHTGHQCHESIIESSSDGYTIDTDPPEIKVVSFGVFENFTHGIEDSLYQQEYDSIEVEWNSTDETSGILYQSWSAGSLPFATDIHNHTTQDNEKVPTGAIALEHGDTIFFTIEAMDNALNIGSMVSPSLTIDTTAPDFQGILDCTPVISYVKPMIYCSWNDPLDSESPIASISASVGLFQFDDSIVSPITLMHGTNAWSTSLHDIFDAGETSLTSVYITVRATNDVGLVSAVFSKVIVDQTAPSHELGRVTVVSSVDAAGERQCQQSNSYIELTVDGFAEDVSQITRYYLSV